MGLFSAYIWHNSSLLYHFRHLSGRNIYSAFILSEKVVFCDYMTWNAGIKPYRINYNNPDLIDEWFFSIALV